MLLPPESKQVDCEGELALVVGRRVRRFPADGDPRAVVAGWLTADDVTARDLQRAEGQWARGKSFELLAWASAAMTLEPGDLVLTGTPAGVHRLRDGDEVRVRVEGLPELRHAVAAEPG